MKIETIVEGKKLFLKLEIESVLDVGYLHYMTNDMHLSDMEDDSSAIRYVEADEERFREECIKSSYERLDWVLYEHCKDLAETLINLEK